MKIKILKLSIFISLSFLHSIEALVPSIEQLPAHDKYYGFYLTKLYQYFDNHFEVKSTAVPLEDLNTITHWNNSKGVPSVAWKITCKKGVITVNQVIPLSFLHSSPKHRLKEESHFTASAPGFPLHHGGIFIFKDFVTKEIRVFNKQDDLESIYYHLSNIQSHWLPEELRKVIYKIGYDTRLPLDKIQITSKGEVIAYYP